jgi:hypothetical protein
MKMAKEKVSTWKLEVRERRAGRELYSDAALSVGISQHVPPPPPPPPSPPHVEGDENNNAEQDSDEDLFAEDIDEDAIPQKLKDNINAIAYGGDSDSDDMSDDVPDAIPTLASYKDHVKMLRPHQYQLNMLVLYKVCAIYYIF